MFVLLSFDVRLGVYINVCVHVYSVCSYSQVSLSFTMNCIQSYRMSDPISCPLNSILFMTLIYVFIFGIKINVCIQGCF